MGSIDLERLKKEYRVLQEKGVQFKFFDLDTDHPYVLMAAITNKRRMLREPPYTLRMDLEGFPFVAPDVCTTRMLYTKSGKPLDNPQHGMHCLGSKHGGTQICHFGSSWHPMISLYKVFIKCRIWLEAYELHLDTGMKLDYYLKIDQGQEFINYD